MLTLIQEIWGRVQDLTFLISSHGRGKTGASVTDKLDMSQMSVATKKEKN